MATPNTSMTATGLSNADSGDGQPILGEINRDLLETLDRYGEESADKSPPQQEETTTTTTTTGTPLVEEEQGNKETGPVVEVGLGEETGKGEEDEGKKAQQQQQQPQSTEVMCS